MALRTEESRTQGAGREEREEGVDLGVCRARGYATHRGSWKPKSIDIDKRPERKFRQGFIGALSATGSQTSDKFPCLLLGGWGEGYRGTHGKSGPLNGVRAGWVQHWVGGLKSRSAHRLGVLCAGITPRTPTLVLQLQRGDWILIFFLFLSSALFAPAVHVCRTILSPLSFPCLWHKICVHMEALQPRYQCV